MEVTLKIQLAQEVCRELPGLHPIISRVILLSIAAIMKDVCSIEMYAYQYHYNNFI